MATRFDELVDAIIADYQASTGDTTTTFERGQLRRAELSAPRRVVFVRDGGEFGFPRRSTSQDFTPIAEQLERVAAHIFAPDDATAETIMLALVRSYAACLGSAWVDRSAEYDWYTQTDEGGRFDVQGTLILLRSVWRLGLTEETSAPVRAPLDQLSHESSLGHGEFSSAFGRDFRFAGSTTPGCSS